MSILSDTDEDAWLQAAQCVGGVKALIRPRPSSLSVEKRQFLRSASQDTQATRPVSSMSTFSCSSVTQPSTPASGTPSKRSRSLQVEKGFNRLLSINCSLSQRGRVPGPPGPGHQRNSRSVSSDDGERGIRRQAQLSHSTPQVRTVTWPDDLILLSKLWSKSGLE